MIFERRHKINIVTMLFGYRSKVSLDGEIYQSPDEKDKIDNINLCQAEHILTYPSVQWATNIVFGSDRFFMAN